MEDYLRKLGEQWNVIEQTESIEHHKTFYKALDEFFTDVVYSTEDMLIDLEKRAGICVWIARVTNLKFDFVLGYITCYLIEKLIKEETK